MIRLQTHSGRFDLGRLAARWGRAAEPPSAREQSPPPFPTGRASTELEFTAASVRDARRLVAREAERTRLSRDRREDLVLAVDELATNSITHGGGRGTLSVWREDRAIACEVRDRGHIEDPLVGSRPPDPERLTGRGLWVVSRLCDRVHISSSPGRTAVRVQMRVR
jgi:anti-sigma regulatory factor (Ser/Thr protein kinase)